ncbi:SAVMC3_10250 family protein [Actinophytocola sp.]|uniref:SAVMC3_10250 family protein n=1 Tax=Actinophytocola sp. TaxID=1872138 RepID=UPI0038998896
MRELVYRSNRKLQEEFDLGAKPHLFDRVKANIKVPVGLGEVTVETTGRQPGLPKIDTVLAELDRDDRAPVWFTDPVQAGQWVRFEAPMSYTLIDPTVVFLDVDAPSPHVSQRR